MHQASDCAPASAPHHLLNPLPLGQVAHATAQALAGPTEPRSVSPRPGYTRGTNPSRDRDGAAAGNSRVAPSAVPGRRVVGSSACSTWSPRRIPDRCRHRTFAIAWRDGREQEETGGTIVHRVLIFDGGQRSSPGDRTLRRQRP